MNGSKTNGVKEITEPEITIWSYFWQQLDCVNPVLYLELWGDRPKVKYWVGAKS